MDFVSEWLSWSNLFYMIGLCDDCKLKKEEEE